MGFVVAVTRSVEGAVAAEDGDIALLAESLLFTGREDEERMSVVVVWAVPDGFACAFHFFAAAFFAPMDLKR